MTGVTGWRYLNQIAVDDEENEATKQGQIVKEEVEQAPTSSTPSSSASSSTKKSHYTFAVVPKQYIEFFEPTRKGCQDQATRLSQELGEDTEVECLFIGPTDAENRGEVQAMIVEEILFGNESLVIDGLSISVVGADLMTPILNRAREELNIPVITFDSDAPDSLCSYYLGTNNSFFGRQLARQMESLNPTGGTFGIISGESKNLQDRANGILQELVDQQTAKVAGSGGHTWEQFPDSPFDSQNNQTLALEKLKEWASQNPTVLLSVTGLPMRIEEIEDENGNIRSYAPWKDFVGSNRHRNITLLCADASPHQLAFLETDYVDGLAGQLPYDMGIKSINTLWTLYHYTKILKTARREKR